MHTTLRPYTKVVTLNAGDISGIELRDSAGDLLECNYINITTSGDITGTLLDYTVFLSSIAGLTTPLTPTTVTSFDGSGFCGLLGSAEGIKPVEIFLEDSDRISEVGIYTPFAGNFVITYGNIHISNPMRLNNRSKGA